MGANEAMKIFPPLGIIAILPDIVIIAKIDNIRHHWRRRNTKQFSA
jgi:hypothetical protein